MKNYFVASDFHGGASDKIDVLCKAIMETPCDHAIFCGDIGDKLRSDEKTVYEVVSKIFSHALKRFKSIDICIGNHDFLWQYLTFLQSFSSSNTKIYIHGSEGFALNGIRFLHGDLFDSYWQKFNWFVKIWLWIEKHLIFRQGHAEQYLNLSYQIKKHGLDKYLDSLFEAAKDYGLENTIVMGHAHVQANEIRDDKRLIIVGDFFENTSYIEIIDGKIHFRSI